MLRLSPRFSNIEVTGDVNKNGFGVMMGQKPDYRGCRVGGRRRQGEDGPYRQDFQEL